MGEGERARKAGEMAGNDWVRSYRRCTSHGSWVRDHFATAFSHDVDLLPEDSALRSLCHLSAPELKSIQKDITALVVTHDARESWNWQATADMIVTGNSDELSYGVSGKFETIEALRDHGELLLSPFVDYSERSASLEAERCAALFLPTQNPGSRTLAARGRFMVLHIVFASLYWARGVCRKLESTVGKVQTWIGEQDWTRWKEDRGCEDNDICVVPIWPMGSG